MEKVVKIKKLHDVDNDDIEYWLSKTPQERIDAVEILRQQYEQNKNAPTRLQRVCRIIEHKKS